MRCRLRKHSGKVQKLHLTKTIHIKGIKRSTKMSAVLYTKMKGADAYVGIEMKSKSKNNNRQKAGKGKTNETFQRQNHQRDRPRLREYQDR